MTAMLQRINSPPLDIAKANPSLPDDLCELMRKVMTRSPRDRWPSMATLASALRELPSIASGRSARRLAEADEPEPAPSAVESGGDFLDLLGVAPAAEPNAPAGDADFLDALGVAPEAAGPTPAQHADEAPCPAEAAPAGGEPARRPIPQDVREAVWRRERGRCVRCGGKEELKFKHLVPVAVGGQDTPENIRLVCKPCRHALRAKA
jgi:hypothetical protein